MHREREQNCPFLSHYCIVCAGHGKENNRITKPLVISCTKACFVQYALPENGTRSLKRHNRIAARTDRKEKGRHSGGNPLTGLRAQVTYPPTHTGFLLCGAEKRFPPLHLPCRCGRFPRLERVPCAALRYGKTLEHVQYNF